MITTIKLKTKEDIENAIKVCEVINCDTVYKWCDNCPLRGYTPCYELRKLYKQGKVKFLKED